MPEPNKPQLPPESHYDPKKLDKLFAIITIILLVAIVGIWAKDYAREWKQYQKQFKALELEKTKIKMDGEENELAKNEEYQGVLKQLAEAQGKFKSQESSLKAVKSQIAAIEAVKRLNVQQSQFAKAEYDALRYSYEEADHQGGVNAPALKTRLDNLGVKIEALRLKIEANEGDIKAKAEVLKNAEKDYKDLDKKRGTIAKKADIIERKLKKIDPERMGIANQIADTVRDWPMLELANPNYKIRQIVLKDIPEDVNFMKVPRVDRCTTCHLGIDNPDFKNAAQPYRTHPNLELYVNKNSPHPLQEFGCTTCHMGRGRATDFVSATHSPRNEEQEKIWEKKYKWQALHHWDQPMLPVGLIEASCFKCHQDQTVVKGAEKLNLGLNLIERAGCFGCHEIQKYKNWPKSGPGLDHLAAKTTPNWAYHWIINPKSIRHNTWMPSYFNQSNNQDPQSFKRSQQEVLSIVKYLFTNSKPYEMPAVAAKGSASKGKELVASLGCMACHQVEPNKSEAPRTRDSLRREFGPNLIGLGSKTSEQWLYDWLKNPNRYHADTKMPSLRLSDQEAADIASYLAQDKSAVVDKPAPAVDDKVLDGIVMDFLKKSETMAGAQTKLKAMDQNAKLMFAGQKLIREYGCYGCHNISGFENEKPIGPELTEIGTKSLHRLDFGFINVEDTKQGWFKQKLMDPRSYDRGRVHESLDKLRMPNFKFTEEEAEAVTTALLGFVRDRPNANKMPNQGVEASFINEGRRVIRQLNCQGCHIIEGEGRSVQDSIAKWLVDFQGKSETEAASFLSSFVPPNLLGEGAKVQAQWLFEFLHNPTPIRPWLSIRMPTYNYKSSQTNSLVKYFNYLDGQEFPFTDMYHPNLSKEEFAAAEKMFSKEVFGCTLCHIVGDQMPSGSQDTWAPNLGLAAGRLKPDWIVKWITNPPALLPGTKMPVFFDPNSFDQSGPPDILDGDEHRQIKALRDYLLTISAQPQLYKKEIPKAVEAPKAEKAPDAPAAAATTNK